MKIQLSGQNVVNFDMQAESGRLIVGVKLSDEIRNTFLVICLRSTSSYYADGTVSGLVRNANLIMLHKDDLLTFISQIIDKSNTRCLCRI